MGYLSGWSYYKIISLTGQTGAGTLYQVDLDIGASTGGDFHLENHCTNFPQDIEVTDNDGTTLLDFWIEDLTADPFNMYVEVADDLGSNQSIWVYYGKSGATTNSNGPNTFIQWHGAASSNFHDANNCTPPFIYEGKAKQTSDSEYIMWGVGEDNDLDAQTGDSAAIMSYGSGDLRYMKSFNDGVQSYTSEAPNLVQNQWHKLKLDIIDSTHLHGYVDSNEISTGITTNIPNEAMGLTLDINSGSGEQEWSFVRKYNSPEPAFASAGAEQSVPGVGNPYWYYQMLRRRN